MIRTQSVCRFNSLHSSAYFKKTPGVSKLPKAKRHLKFDFYLEEISLIIHNRCRISSKGAGVGMGLSVDAYRNLYATMAIKAALIYVSGAISTSSESGHLQESSFGRKWIGILTVRSKEGYLQEFVFLPLRHIIKKVIYRNLFFFL